MRSIALTTVWLGLAAGLGSVPTLGQQATAPPPAPVAQQAVQAQTPPGQAAPQAGQGLPGIDSMDQWKWEQLGPNHWKSTGDVEIQRGDMKIFADEMEYFTDTNVLTARGNFTLTTPTQTISADSAEFNTKTGLGVFYKASGTATLEDPKKPAASNQFGAQDREVLFYGEKIEKIGERKYRITDGAFTSCVQPKPRWEMVSGSIVLNIDHYALLKGTVLRVKGVPVMYLPIVYYPISRDDRATGFLMPIYGTSTLRGHSLSNAFFWAMGKSADLTLMHDWYSKTGQSYGAEGRYVRGGASRGAVSFNRLNEKPTVLENPDGSVSNVAGSKSFQVRGDFSQELPLRLKARGRVDYFSNIRTQQTYNTNVYQTSLWQRSFSGGVSGVWGAFTASAEAARSEFFESSTKSRLTGSWPRLTVGRGEKAVWRLPLYFTLNADYGQVLTEYRDEPAITEFNHWRANVTPVLRVPFTRWQFLTVNSAVAWRYTWYSESLEAGKQVEVPVTRSYFDMSSRIVGPVFNKVWNLPGNGYAEKLKHTIEPSVILQRITAIENDSQIVKADASDYVIGDTTRVTYALNNRFYAKVPAAGGKTRSQQILNIGVRQTYYTDSRAATYDFAYSTFYGRPKPSNFSPVSLSASVTPMDGIDGSFRAEYDASQHTWRSFGASATFQAGDWISTSGGWSLRRYNAVTVGSQNSNHYVTNETSLRLGERRQFGAYASFNYDVQNGFFMQRRFTGYYNPQCCGIAVEFQTQNLAGVYYPGYRPPVPKDRRFSVSFTLAGLGTFSNFLGFFGVGQGYR